MASTRLSIRLTHGRRRLSASDWFIVAAAISALFCGSLSTWFVCFYFKSENTTSKEPTYGLRLSEKEMKVYLKVEMAVLLDYYLFLWILKSSFVAQYLVLRKHMKASLRWMVTCSALFVAATFATVMIVPFMWCKPLSEAWTLSDHCWIQCRGTLFIFFCCHLSSNTILLLIPILLATQLRLSRRDISGLFFVVALALATICIAIARFVYLWDFIKRGWDARFGLYSHMLACIEKAIGMTAACLPALRILQLHKTESLWKKRISSVSSDRTPGDIECAFPVTEAIEIHKKQCPRGPALETEHGMLGLENTLNEHDSFDHDVTNIDVPDDEEASPGHRSHYHHHHRYDDPHPLPALHLHSPIRTPHDLELPTDYGEPGMLDRPPPQPDETGETGIDADDDNGDNDASADSRVASVMRLEPLHHPS
ncbi:hypothetical protein EX30DRAFT_343278 [Ascodesmis nigricans]|uniref:Rhodopsin domain-containing protein n=1 Tax=Ascodesmis nigricans TaxID=341454 RepID=A0A4S2MS35_9PEZI|nr:hypothetical protein EX30DRAFT_343278 [Ascodesmis nigricans]